MSAATRPSAGHRVLDTVARYRKAIGAGAVSALAFAGPVIDDGLLPSEVVGIVLAALVGAGVTGFIPNRRDNTAERGRG